MFEATSRVPWKAYFTQIYFSPIALYVYGLVLLCNVILILVLLQYITLPIKHSWLLIHSLEAILTMILLGEVALRAIVHGSPKKYLSSLENIFDFLIACSCAVFLLCMAYKPAEIKLQEIFGDSLMTIRTLLRVSRIYVFLNRHNQKQEIYSDDMDVDFMLLEDGSSKGHLWLSRDVD